jgi:hypothetical protein
MATLKEIEMQVAQLPSSDLSEFRQWFSEFDADAWDKQFEQDVSAGRLDRIVAEPLADFESGHCRKI